MPGDTIIQFPSNRVPPGTRLNGIYEIDSLIAEGGMGEVYRGHNIQTQDPVAIKMMLPELSGNPEAMALFRREASTLHNLYNEAIVRYYVFSIDPDLQRAYLAMEFVDGVPLSQRLKQGPLDLASVKVLQRRLAEGLHAAHAVGVIHRDISPDNVILPGGDVRRAKIIDFGIARSLQSSEATIIGGGFAGKYNYVSPEQLGLFGGDVTPKSDIYSLGLVLAECLRGRPLEMSGTQFEIVEKRRTLPDLAAIDASIRPLLQAMLAPDPAGRPADMNAVARWGEAERITPLAGTTIGHPEPRSRWPLLAGAAAIVLLAAGAAGYQFRGDIATAVGLAEPEVEVASSPAIPPDPGLALPAPTASQTADALPPPQTVPDAAPLPDLPAPAATTAAPKTPADTTPAATTPAATAPLAPEQQQAAAPVPKVPTAEDLLGAREQQLAAAPPAAAPPAAAPPANAAPQPPRSSLTLGDATIGRDYEATLPPFTDPDGSGALKLTSAPDLPQGLAFRDGGAGVGIISGRPTAPGRYDFAVTAIDPAGASASMRLALNVAAPPEPAPAAAPLPEPAQAPLPQPQVAAPSPAPLPAPLPAPTPAPAAPVDVPLPDIQPSAPPPATPEVAIALPPTTPAPAPQPDAVEPVTQWVRDFGGGACFYLRNVEASGQSAFIEGFGNDVSAFQRLDGDFKRAFGFEPKIAMRKVAEGQCPALQLAATTRGGRPTIEISSPEVGRDKPLTGTVRDAAGRHVALLLVSNDGEATNLGRFVSPGDGAFTVSLKPDARSQSAPQLLVAVASGEPLAVLRDFRSGRADQLFEKLRLELGDGPAAALDVKQFRMKD